MISGGRGGGNTATGLVFEKKGANLADCLSKQEGYKVLYDGKVLYKKKEIGQILEKYKLYKFLKERGVDWKKIISSRLLPDNAIYIKKNKKLYIIECKYQQVSGSVDEKLQTCDFKKRQYEKLVSKLKIKVQFIYVLDEWYNKKPKYRDVLKYIKDVGCSYYFKKIPLDALGLPHIRIRS